MKPSNVPAWAWPWRTRSGGARRSGRRGGRCRGTPRSRGAPPRASSWSARSAGARAGGAADTASSSRSRATTSPSSRRRPAAGAARRSPGGRSRGSRRRSPSAPRRRPRPRARPAGPSALEHPHAAVGQHRDELVRPVQRASRGCRARRGRARRAAAGIGEDGASSGSPHVVRSPARRTRSTPSARRTPPRRGHARARRRGCLPPQPPDRGHHGVLPRTGVVTRAAPGTPDHVPPIPNELNGMIGNAEALCGGAPRCGGAVPRRRRRRLVGTGRPDHRPRPRLRRQARGRRARAGRAHGDGLQPETRRKSGSSRRTTAT